MSLAELKNELRERTPAELTEIEQFASEIRAEKVEKRIRKTPEEAIDYLFENYGDLLKRLAK
jgi:hypothetical protein